MNKLYGSMASAEAAIKAQGQNAGQHQQRMIEQQEKAMQQTQDKQRAMEQYEKLRQGPSQAQSAPPTSPIRTTLVLLDTRLSDLQATVERLFSALRPVTTNTDDNRPGEPAVAREGNSSLNIDINAMADRLEVITVALQVQVDRLEV
jgi:hypothetical protein